MAKDTHFRFGRHVSRDSPDMTLTNVVVVMVMVVEHGQGVYAVLMTVTVGYWPVELD